MSETMQSCFVSKEITEHVMQKPNIGPPTFQSSDEKTSSIPANHPDSIRIVPIFEFQNPKKSGNFDFQEGKKDLFFSKNLELGR